MNLDKESYFPLYSSTSNTPSIFSAPSTTSQHGNINSFSGLLNGFNTDSNQVYPMSSINDPMQFSRTSLHSQPQTESFGFDHFQSNFSPNYRPLQIQNEPLLEYFLRPDHNTPAGLIGLNNSLLNVPNYNDLNAQSPAVLSPSSLPVGNDKVLIGGDDNNKVKGDGSNIKNKPKKSTKKSTRKSAGNGGSNIQVTAARRKAYKRKSRSIFGGRSSMYRGVSRYARSFEAFLWDNTDPSVKGRTVYVGGFEREEDAARAYDLAALKYWGPTAPLNFPINDYKKELETMQYVSREEFLLNIRRKSKGFAKGVSNYRGVSRNSDGKKWQARLGKGKGLKGLYLGTFQTEVEAARAYDVAVLRIKGLHAMTNFDLNHYDIRYILESSRLPIGKGASKRLQMTPVEDVLQLSKKTCNKRFLDLQVPDDHDHCFNDHQIMISEPNPHDHQDQSTLGREFQSNALIPTPTSTENLNNITTNALDNQNPSSYFEYDSPSGGTSIERNSQDHDSVVQSNIINRIANRALEDFQLFDVKQFYLNQNSSFENDNQPQNYQMQNPDKSDHDELQKNPSFLNLFTVAKLIENHSNDDQEQAFKNLTMMVEAGHDNDDVHDEGASTDIFWSEFQQTETPEFRNIDFYDLFFYDDHNNIDADFQNQLQNPSNFLDGFNGSTTQGGSD